MITRTVWLLLGVAALGFGVLGSMALPLDVLLGGGLLGLVLGLGVRRLVGWFPASRQVFDVLGPWARTDGLALVGAVAVCFFVTCLVVTGMVVVMGGIWTTSILFAAASAWAALRSWPGMPPPGPHAAVPVTGPPARVKVADLSTVELCAAWQQSYYDLVRAVDSPVRERLVRRRQEYLDELERRDGAGFARWMANGARASSDPRRYLTAGS
ncbi:MAG: hypothetical protein ABW224_10460 [Kibdelosporangium sp.]